MRVAARIGSALLAQRGHLFCWVPVWLGVGIGVYFSMPVEPGLSTGGVAVLLGGSAFWGLRRLRQEAAPVFWAAIWIAIGFCLGMGRAHLVAAPVLDWRYYGAVEGRVVAVDRSASDAVRLTLDDLRLDRMAAQNTPRHLRVSLHGVQPITRFDAGSRVMMTAFLSPPPGPVEPGGFDFQRHAWFQGLGAIGYTRAPVLRIAPATGAHVYRMRQSISCRIQSRLSGDVGGFAAAVTTGDRSGMSQDALDALRVSNMAHLLAISGLHMGLLVAFVFLVIRSIFALIPAFLLRIPSKKIAAGVALMAAVGYLALSGGNVATERAFIMAAVGLVAVMLDRRVLSLRAVALAATLVLVLRPESLLGPGFQMSFAATTALIVVFAALRDWQITFGPAWVRPVATVALSSLVAGAATAPVAAAHFNTVSHYGLLANVVSVPVMGLIVVPCAVIAACLSPFGLAKVGLWGMGLGLDWILNVAQAVAALDGARGFVPSPSWGVLPLLALGAIWMILWQGRARWIGVLPVLGAIWYWGTQERPLVLVADTGRVVGVMTENGRAISKPKGGGFVVRNWLENDGTPTSQAKAALLWPETIDLAGKSLRIVQGKRNIDAFTGCKSSEILVMSHTLSQDYPCEILNPKTLAATGAIAISVTNGHLRVTSAREVSGRRLWNDPDVRHTRDRQTQINKYGSNPQDSPEP